MIIVVLGTVVKVSRVQSDFASVIQEDISIVDSQAQRKFKVRAFWRHADS